MPRRIRFIAALALARDEDSAEEEVEGEREEPKSEEDERRECTLDDLVKGAKVSEAQLELHRGKLYWTKLELS